MEELYMEAATHTSATTPSPELTDAERELALAAHDRTDRDFLAAIVSLNEAQWTFHSSPDSWSIQGVAEHVTVVEMLVGKRIQKTMAGEPDPQWMEKCGLLSDATKTRVLDRSKRVQAPDPVQPTNTWTIEETARRFREVRAISQEMLERPGLALKSHVGTAGPGTYNCYDWLMWISLHHQRHLLQIAEGKANPAFPH
jgi:hypothetical protein